MQKAQTYVWEDESGNTIAILEIQHKKFEMLLSVIAEVAEKVRKLMAELHQEGLYPNEEVSPAKKLFAQFLISQSYNWNCRWRDLVVMLNKILGTYGFDPEECR